MIGNRIKRLRNSLKLTQNEFAANIGMTNSAVHEWEHDKVEMKESSLLLIELRYGVNPEWLREGRGEVFEPSISPLETFVNWIKTLSPDKKAWLKVELEEHFEQYRNWLEGYKKQL